MNKPLFIDTYAEVLRPLLAPNADGEDAVINLNIRIDIPNIQG